MLDDFLIRAMLAGVGLSLATGPLGAFVVWRRMAYFGDAMAHAAILGVALALAFSISVTVGTLAVALAMGLSVAALVGRGHGMDAVLGVLAHSALALGLVAISFVDGVRIDLTAFLFGDILTVTKGDLAVIWGGSAAVLILLIWRWAPLLTSTLNEELAASAGIDPRREQMVLTLALAVVVALALKVVGALLIAALRARPRAWRSWRCCSAWLQVWAGSGPLSLRIRRQARASSWRQRRFLPCRWGLGPTGRRVRQRWPEPGQELHAPVLRTGAAFGEDICDQMMKRLRLGRKPCP